jgi:signal transduction histidine kinase
MDFCSRIDVSLTRDAEYALISVRDEGIGIAAEMLPRIFDAFYVTKENNLAKNGLGIGLWLARSLVQLHAGTLVAKSEGPTRGPNSAQRFPWLFPSRLAGHRRPEALLTTPTRLRTPTVGPLR